MYFTARIPRSKNAPQTGHCTGYMLQQARQAGSACPETALLMQNPLCLLLRTLRSLRTYRARSSQKERKPIQVTAWTKTKLTSVLVSHPLTALKIDSHLLEHTTCLLHSYMFSSRERQQQCYTNIAKGAVK